MCVRGVGDIAGGSEPWEVVRKGGDRTEGGRRGDGLTGGGGAADRMYCRENFRSNLRTKVCRGSAVPRVVSLVK